jgi:hypothetical protein
VRTQYFCEELDGEAGMFPPARLGLLAGSHPRQRTPTPGRACAFLVDVGGEAASATTPGRADCEHDQTALTIVEICPPRPAGEDRGEGWDELGPLYHIVERRLWSGASQPHIYTQISALADAWRPARLVIDATGLGAGLAAFLERRYPGRLRPFVFTQASKSALGWRLLQLVETGRLKDWAAGPDDAERLLFLRQAAACEMTVLPGPGQILRWGVPDGRRDPASGAPLHDDLLISAALAGLLEEEPLAGSASPSVLIPAQDPLAALGEVL